MLGDPVGDVGREQRQRDLDLRVARTLAHAQGDPADGNAEQHLADHDDAEGARGLRQREQPGRDRRNRKAVEDQRGRVIGEPSPSSTVRMRRGRPSLRAIASGATTSGGATMAPSRKPTLHGSPIR